MKKRVLLLAAIVALIAGAGIAYAAGSGGGLPGGEPAVWGGGHVDWGPDFGGVQRDFSIVATPDGGKFVYGQLGLGTNPDIGSRVTCMRVSGNNVVIGGLRTNPPGAAWIAFMTDNGELAATPDLLSGVYLWTKADAGWGGTTKYFPYVCPPWSAIPWDEIAMFNLTSGDIVVQNATQNSQQ